MDNKIIFIVAGVAALILIVVVLLLIKRSRRKSLKKKIDELYVRFTGIKTIPIPFKLSKAQAMAKRSEELTKQVNEYYNRFEDVEKHINQIQEMLNNTDDDIAIRTYKESLEAIRVVSENLDDCEEEVRKIDEFLENFSKKENEQREYSTRLKEKYRVIRTTINKNAQALSVSFDGFMDKLKECEGLFSSSEEYMYASDYGSAQQDLEKIEDMLTDIKKNANIMSAIREPLTGTLAKCIEDVKDLVSRTRQRGIYIDHLDPKGFLEKIENQYNEDMANVRMANLEGVKEHVENSQKELNEFREALENEKTAFDIARDTNNKVLGHINDLEKVENYVRIAYDKDSARFGLENLNDELKQKRDNISKYMDEYKRINGDLNNCIKPSTELLSETEKLFDDVDKDLKALYSYKSTIDKSTDGENRAINQLTKLQLVVSEVETKLSEYHLPIIDDSYKADLKKSREYIDELRDLTAEIPINIDELNEKLNEAIDFIYKFYNNIYNVIGMAMMVEKAIVFGNKYRSSYPEIDRELSKAEFQYMNGEYTKALKTAISCMESLFPDNADEKIMENA